jgi:hypothetical protein
MELAFQIIVVILSVSLLIFLALAIAVSVLVFKLVKAVQQIVEKGDHLIDSASELGGTLKRNAAAASVIKMLISFVTTISNAKKRRK